jgi:hypothetical protein
MREPAIAAGLLALVASPAFANDSMATLGAGGLTFVTTDKVEMLSDFHLTIDKGNPRALVSFCWDGKVTKTGPTTFSMHATDFSPPDHELEILLLNPQQTE